MASLLIHIGLPKTATTTLQKIYFPKVSEMNERIKYHGVFQPRESEQSELYRLIYKYVHTGNDLESCKTFLKSLLIENNLIHIISEEMFVVSDNTTWRQKLSRLFQLLIGVDFKILVTIREPISATFSYFAERYPYYKKKSLSYNQALFSHESMEIYSYEILFNEILKYTIQDSVVIMKFEDIIENRLQTLNELLNVSENELDLISLPILNSKKNTGKGVIKVENKKLIDVLRSILPGFVFSFINKVLKSTPNIKFKINQLVRKNIKKKHNVRKMTNEEKKQASNHFGKDLKYLKSELGVSFD